MRSLLPTALTVVLLVAPSASAQCLGPGCGWGFGFGGPKVRGVVWGPPIVPVPWGFSYGYTFNTAYFNPWVVPPPMAIPLPPTLGVFSLADEMPTTGGVDLAALRKKLTDDRDAEQQVKERVDAAVKRGEFVVFEPGKPLPKRAEVPPVKVPDSPKPAEAVSPKPDARPPADPAALARFHLHRGQAAFDAGELGRATERFAAAVAADPKLGEAYFNLAQTRIARGQYTEAMEAIRTGMKNVPGWADARWSTTDLYLAHPKRLTADVDDLKAAVAAAPTDSTRAFLYAHHLWFSGEKVAATELFRQLDGKVKEKELVQPFLKK